MSHKTIKSNLNDMVHDRLVMGESKHEAKLHDDKVIKQCDAAGIKVDKTLLEQSYKFFNRSTVLEYENEALRFANWAVYKAKAAGLPVPDVKGNEIKDYLVPYIEKEIKEGKYTARTIATHRCQLAKVFRVDLAAEVQIPEKWQSESNKGRSPDPRWAPQNHKDFEDFCRMIGARKEEYIYLSNPQIKSYEAKLDETFPRDRHGRVSNLQPIYNLAGEIEKVRILKAKHGKTNVSIILPENRTYVKDIIEDPEKLQKFLHSGSTRMSERINIHACRREYAQNLYDAYARDVDSLPTEELYLCRGQYAGRVYDRAAVNIVAPSLGHNPENMFDTVHCYLR